MMHMQEIETILATHGTNIAGLSENEATERLETYGHNELIVKEPKPLWLAFLEEFKDVLVIILIAAAILAGIAGKTADAIVILIVVLLNATIGFIQKYKAERAIEALQQLVSPRAIVIREGKQREIDATLVVPGDIIVLAEGNRIAADARLIETHELRVQEAILTGESTPIQKQVNDTENKYATPGEHRNMIYMGTIVAMGTGKAVVTATGMQTEFGRIAHLTTETKKDPSPLQRELQKIGVFVGKITLAISLFLIAIGITIQGKALIDTLLFAASVAVAAVPEGLPATVTIALALGVQRLAKKRAIVKQLASVETLGGTTVICSDKTGTLTKNEMTVQEIVVDCFDIAVHGVGYQPDGALYIRNTQNGACITMGKPGMEDYEHRSTTAQRLKLTHPPVHKALEMISRIAILCNNASLLQAHSANTQASKDEQWNVLGDPTEGALLTIAKKAGFNEKETKKEHEMLYEVPFDSERKRMTTINQNIHNQKIFAYTKGAPDSILEKCSHIFLEGRVQKLDKRMERHILERNEEMAKRALRVLGFAYRELDPKPCEQYEMKDVEKNMIFVGLMGMIDPPREEVKEAVKLTHKAGIKTYIVTGDNGLTAHAIAQMLGITGAYNVRIVTGTEMNQISNDKLTAILKNEKEVIFARVSPEHKLHIVSALKNLGERVAVTGDGVNDAPALKRADIGVAMGITGTDVSREAANMILTDDSYATIVKAIEEGRTIYKNLKKFIFFIFSCNIGELITVFAAIILKMPVPLTAILILIVNLGTDVLPALALGVDGPEHDVMSQKPRNPGRHIMEASFVWRFVYTGAVIGITVVGTYLWALTTQGWSWGEPLFDNSFIYMKSSTIAFAMLIVIQMVNALNARSETRSIFRIGFFSNIWLLGAIAISFIMLILFIEVPFLQTALHTTHLSMKEWGIILLASLSVLVIEEIRKIISNNVRKNQSHT